MSQIRKATTFAAMGALLAVSSGCLATRNQLERGLAEQAAALDAERQERMAADQQMAGDVQRVGSEVQQMAANISQLRSDLAAMDNEFGTKLTQLEQGLQLQVPVHFAFNSANVRNDVDPLLDRFAAVIHQHYPAAMITIEGFTDPAGPEDYNQRLAERRAEAVRSELISRGIPESQIRTVGYGEQRPVVPEAAGARPGAELNRRVVFVIETPATGTNPTAAR